MNSSGSNLNQNFISKIRFIWKWQSGEQLLKVCHVNFYIIQLSGICTQKLGSQYPKIVWNKNLLDPLILIKVVLLVCHYHINLTLLMQLWFRFDLELFKKWSFYKDPLYQIYPLFAIVRYIIQSSCKMNHYAFFNWRKFCFFLQGP